MTASLALAAGLVAPSPGLAADIAAVAAIDTAYQAAVERNDADAMDEMLGDDFVLVLGNGTAFDRKDLLRWAREGKASYTRQVEDAGTQTVRVWGDTAVVTARL
jgi:ketosteroid isomerase-like protein